jgi:ankyrin repeat protein
MVDGTYENIPDKTRWVPLCVAAKFGYLDIVECLLRNKADVCQKDNDGLTPLHHSSNNGH